MTHVLPDHNAAMTVDMNNPAIQQQPYPHAMDQSQGSTPAASSAKKRRKAEPGGDDTPHTPAEPRRLRRSHEACARCRSKKIKCDSKHPKCTACATAGVTCAQEDRYRQTLTPRGHTERIEYQLKQCEALIRHVFDPSFALEALDDFVAKHNVVVDGSAPPPPPSSQYAFGPGPANGANGPPPGPPGPPGHPYPPHMPPPGYPLAPIYGHPGSFQPPPPGFPGYPHPPPMHPAYGGPPSSAELKGVDPNRNDFSSETAIVHTFNLASHFPPAPIIAEPEDLSVGSGSLSSGRDRALNESSVPRDQQKWVAITMRRNTIASLMNPTEGSPMSPQVSIWLPKNRDTVQRIVHAYFERLNDHRPVFSRPEFEQRLGALYDNLSVQHDPGFICSLYLILALGTMSEMSHVVGVKGHDGKIQPPEREVLPSQLMPKDWPEYDEFFERALSVKSDLRVTISSLQALILLHWYLYTERQGRSLWRLVGSLVRLGIELGLHHDPRMQKEVVADPNGQRVQRSLFTEEECQTRIRLWTIVMIHDRGTSVLLGRPLGIAINDANTPAPVRARVGQKFDFSEHFDLSHPIAVIQADIVNSLYVPQKLYGQQLLRHATRIIEIMVSKRKEFPAKYRYYFTGTQDWPMEKRVQLVEDLTTDQGLTLLKLNIARLLLMRAMFREDSGLPAAFQNYALQDAVVAAHNIIVVHNQLLRYPDVGFFVSPIPLHIAAFIIIIGHINGCTRLSPEVEKADVWMALDMLPRSRWRWERKDLNGGHPVLHDYAQRVFKVDLAKAGAPKSPPVLESEDTDWNAVRAEFEAAAGTAKVAVKVEGGFAQEAQGDPRVTAEMTQAGLYPFYPEAVQGDAQHQHQQQSSPQSQQEWAARMMAHGPGAYHQSQNSFMQEEKDVAPSPHGVPPWMQSHHDQRAQMYQMP